jgi:hypothetical protein
VLRGVPDQSEISVRHCGAFVERAGEPKLLDFPELRALPVARYFIFVGGTLAALLFIPGWLLPRPPAIFADQSVTLDRAVIRIKSARKWPEKVILDTGQLTITPPVAMDPPTIQSSIPLPSDQTPDQPNLEAMALLTPDMQPAAINHSTQQIKRGVARTVRTRRAARGPVAHRRTVIGGDCCQFGWIDSGQTSSNAMPLSARRHEPWIEVRSIGRN